MFIENNVKKINLKLTLVFPIVLAVLLMSVTLINQLLPIHLKNDLLILLFMLPFVILVGAGIAFTVLFAKKGYLIFSNEKITDQKFSWKKYLLISAITGLACLLTPIAVIFIINISSGPIGLLNWAEFDFNFWIREVGWSIVYLLIAVSIVSLPIAAGLMLYFYLTFKIIKVRNAKKSSLNSNAQLNN